MALFAQYALVASQEALKDAAWSPESPEDKEATVRLLDPVSFGMSLILIQGRLSWFWNW